MLLLFTTPDDSTIDIVTDWLEYFNFRDYRKVLPSDMARSEIVAHIGGKNTKSRILGVDVCDIKVCWFWKGSHHGKGNSDVKSLDRALADFSGYEYDEIVNFIYNRIINSARWINHPLYACISKPDQLLFAQEVGFSVPASRIVNRLYNIPDDYITKTITGSFLYQENGSVYRDYTTRIVRKDLPEGFMPSLIQEEVAKVFEVRVLYFFGEMYSFYVSEAAPDIDYRRNLSSSGLKFSLCEIPVSLKRKIDRYMRLLNLQMGSLDFIRSISGEYFFLEVNPSGQFRKLSQMFNLTIEKKLALKLMEMHQ